MYSRKTSKNFADISTEDDVAQASLSRKRSRTTVDRRKPDPVFLAGFEDLAASTEVILIVFCSLSTSFWFESNSLAMSSSAGLVPTFVSWLSRRVLIFVHFRRLTDRKIFFDHTRGLSITL